MRILTTCFLWVVLASTGLAADGEFSLRGGDRIVFLGDSITEQKLYTTYIEAYTVTRFPKQKFNFWNSGWGGDTAWLRMRTFPDEKALFAAQGDAQQKLIEAAVDGPLTRDVVSLQPTVVMVNFGMNDHNYEAFREDIFNAYVRGQAEIVKVLKKNGTRVVLMTPQPIENRRPDPDKDPSNQSLRKFSDGLKEVAAKEGAVFVDQFDPYMAILQREHAAKGDVCIGGGDPVHPAPAGHTLMAAIILKQLKAPALVSSAELAVSDDQGGKVVSASQCNVSNLKYEKGTLSFDRTDESLPMPVDERAMAALKLAPVLDDVNRYELGVAGLKENLYDVLIDGEFAATVTKEELAKGWNLATTAGPITRQAQEVLALIFKKNLVGQTLWEAKLRAWRKKELPGLQKQIDDFGAQITAACQPKPHHFEVKPNHNALDAAINSGDFAGYFAGISTWLGENMKTVLQGGGKCGPRSSFAVFINHAFGIPAIGVGQPAHACVAWRGVDGVWRVGYGRGWAASKLDRLSGPEFVEGSLARSRAAQFSQVEHLRWLASTTASHGQASSVMAIAQKIAQAKPSSAIDLNASLKPDAANADPGVEAAKAGQPKAKETVAAKPEAPVKAGPVKAVKGVIRVEAAAFTETDGQAQFSAQKGVVLMDSPFGGKQVYFAQQQNHCWADYTIDAPAKGIYEIVMSVAAINDGQMLEVGSNAYNAVSLVRIPMSHGLWATTKPVDVKLEQGIQKVRVAVLPNERGIAVRWFELKPKGMKE